MVKSLMLLFITGCTTCQPLYSDQDITDKIEYTYKECHKAQFSEEFCMQLVETKEKMWKLENEESCQGKK